MSEGAPRAEAEQPITESAEREGEAPDQQRALLFEAYRTKAVQALQDRAALDAIMTGWLSGPFDFPPEHLGTALRSHELHSRELGAALMGLGAVAASEGTA